MSGRDSFQIATWVEGLCDSSEKRRCEAALKLYRAGVNLFMPLLRKWVDDLSFRELTLPFSRISAEQKRNAPSTIIVGIAVSPETFEQIRIANGSRALADVPADQDAREFEIEMEDGSVKIDILTTREVGGNGAIAGYLKKFGSGIQQVELYVRDVDRATEILRSNFGLEPIYAATREGADGTRVNFFLATTPDAKKLLVELVESSD